jgi:hypothetical protein
LFSGDPVAPATFTKEATAQNYFPEWLIANVALVDTTAFARTYDQKEWAHAFGVTQLTARIDPNLTAPVLLYQWFHGTKPPAYISSGVLMPFPAVFFGGVQAAGPNTACGRLLTTAGPTTSRRSGGTPRRPERMKSTRMARECIDTWTEGSATFLVNGQRASRSSSIPRAR